MSKWKKTLTHHNADGTGEVIYKCDGSKEWYAQSKRVAIRHADGNGYWLSTEFWAVNDYTREHKQFSTLKSAKAFVEEHAKKEEEA